MKITLTFLFIGMLGMIMLWIQNTPHQEAIINENILHTTVPQAERPESYNACIGCHGLNGGKNTMAPSSRPNTMSKKQIIEALKGYKEGTINKYGKGALMRGFSSRLSEKQMREIADYIVR